MSLPLTTPTPSLPGRDGAVRPIAPRRRRHGAMPLVMLVVALVFVVLALPGCGLVVSHEVHPSGPPGVPGRVMRSVVDVHVRITTDDWTVEEGLGTGVVFNRPGVIVTNDHVVDLGGRHGVVSVETLDGRTAPATVIARFPRLDLAFLKVKLGGLRPARFLTDVSQIRDGDHVIAIGAPHHFKRAVARGRVLRVLTDVVVQRVPGLRALLESSAGLRQGFSGGPLADAKGRVAGIDMATSSEPGAANTSLSIPAPIVLQAAAQAGLLPSGG